MEQKSLEEEKSDLLKLVETKFDDDYLNYLKEAEKASFALAENKRPKYELKYNYKGAFNAR